MATTKYPSTSLILSTYNRPDALSLCLQSIAKQTILPDEVIIGDDGSREETRNLIKEFQKDFPVPLIHLWHEDNGFRLAMCRNKSVALCKSEYIIEIDGDLILSENFVKDHLTFAKPGYFLKGGRVNINATETDQLCQTRRYKKINFFSKGLLRRINSIRNIPVSRYLLDRYKKNGIQGLGCNMSFWKSDFIRINGYDEFFIGWGGEDYDFAFRMINSGVKRMYMKFSGIVYHLWHEDKHMQNKDKNFDYYHNVVKEGRVRTQEGIGKYLNASFDKDTIVYYPEK